MVSTGFRGKLACLEFIAFRLQNERVLAGMNINAGRKRTRSALIRSRQAVSAAALAHLETPLGALSATTSCPPTHPTRPRTPRGAKSPRTMTELPRSLGTADVAAVGDDAQV